MRRLFTIGYEGAKLQDFISTLQASGVGLLLDVRELAISRRRGFSKGALSAALQSAGIAYRHERSLGSPGTIRHKLRADGNYASFFRDFRRYLRSQSDVLAELAEELTGSVALMCYESDHTTCHRSVVAEALSALTDLQPKHLGVKDAGKGSDAPCAHPRQGIPATE